MKDKELEEYCTTEYYDGLCDICTHKEDCSKYVAKYGSTPLFHEGNITDAKVGDRVVVTELPGTDIYGNEYDETGGGGIIVEIGEYYTTIELYDGYLISVENGNYDIC